MPSYRLLRSNKESGPYTLNDLLALGLKPYDLVWVDGRSAAWRYPSEISELKEFAPVVEEQPYDRFFKKPSKADTQEKNTPPVPTPVAETVPPQKTINEIVVNEGIQKQTNNSPEYEQKNKEITPNLPSPPYPPQPKKPVFVSMPETNGFSSYTDQYKEQKYEQYLPKSKPVQNNAFPAEEKSYSPINIHESDETNLETKYTQSLDDIKEMYINTLVQRKTRNRRKEIIKRYIKPAIVPLLLVVTGVAIGYFITKRKNPVQASQSVSTVVPSLTSPEQKKEEAVASEKIVQPGENQNTVSPTENQTDKIIKPQQQEAVMPGEKAFTQPRKENNSTAAISRTVKSPKKEKETFIPPDDMTLVPKRNVEVDPRTGERKSVVRDNDDVAGGYSFKNNEARSNKKNNSEPVFLENEHKDIRDLVSVKSNEYIRGAFGGIRGLELTVYNNSNFFLDEVSVELQILKPSDQPLRTDIITFHNISANDAITVKVPDSQRGIRIGYRITNIESKQWQKSTAGL